MTCSERNRRKAEEEEALTNDWATMHGMKKCPSCQVWIEKTFGCSRVECRCGAHICWKCMRTFPERTTTYAHLREVHGKAFTDDDEMYAAQLQQECDEERQRDLQRARAEAEIRRREQDAAREQAERWERERIEREQALYRFQVQEAELAGRWAEQREGWGYILL